MAESQESKSSTNNARTHREEFRVNGDQLLAKVRELINEGNIRRIIIKNKDGRVLVELPLTLGVVGAVIAPPLAAVGAIAALVTECSIVVERADTPDAPTAPSSSAETPESAADQVKSSDKSAK